MLIFMIFVFSLPGNATVMSRANCSELQKMTQAISRDIAAKKAKIDKKNKLYAELRRQTNRHMRKHKQAEDDKKKLKRQHNPSSEAIKAANDTVNAFYRMLVGSKSTEYRLHLELIRLAENYKAAQKIKEIYHGEKTVCAEF